MQGSVCEPVTGTFLVKNENLSIKPVDTQVKNILKSLI